MQLPFNQKCTSCTSLTILKVMQGKEKEKKDLQRMKFKEIGTKASIKIREH